MPKNAVRIIRKSLLVFFCFLFIAVYPRPAEVCSLKLFQKAEILFYTQTEPQTELPYFFNGVNYQITTDEKGAQAVRQTIEPLCQTAIFYGDINAVLRYLKVCVKENLQIGGGTLISGYSGLIKGRTVKGVNIQIYQKGDKIYLGSPLICGSY